MNNQNQEIQVNTYTEGNQRYPSITKLKNVGFVIVWQSMGQEQDGSGHGVYGQIFEGDGQKIGAESLINTTTEHSQFAPCVASLETGGFVVTWTSNYQDSSGEGIFGQVFDAERNKIGDEFPVNTYTTGNQCNSKVTSLKNGNFVATWESSGQDASGYGIFAQIFDVKGNKIGDEFQVNTFTKYSQKSPSVATLENGGFVVTWESYGQNNSGYEIYARRYDASAKAVSDEFLVNINTTNDQTSSAVTGLINGGFVIAWESLNQDDSGYGIFARCWG
jgi:hypothetical protein